MNTVIRNKAFAAYRELIDMLENIFKTCRDELGKSNKSFNVRFAMEKFDVLLQYSMLEVALRDNYFHIEEASLINDITKYGDFCAYLNANGFKNIGWDDIYRADESDVQRILELIHDDMIELSNDFVLCFSLVDIVIEQIDFTTIFLKKVLEILIAVAYVDGEYEQFEVDDDILIIKIGIAMGNVVAEQQEKMHKPASKKSLKDFYIKKN